MRTMFHEESIAIRNVALEVPGEHLIEDHRELGGDAAVVSGVCVGSQTRLQPKRD